MCSRTQTKISHNLIRKFIMISRKARVLAHKSHAILYLSKNSNIFKGDIETIIPPLRLQLSWDLRHAQCTLTPRNPRFTMSVWQENPSQLWHKGNIRSIGNQPQISKASNLLLSPIKTIIVIIHVCLIQQNIIFCNHLH